MEESKGTDGEGEKQEQLTNARRLEVYFQNFQLNYRRTDISFAIKFEAFFDDGSPIMEKTLRFGSDISINKVGP